MRCIVCGTEIPENCAFCPECGVKVESMEAAIPQPGDFSGQAAAATSAEQGEATQHVAGPGAPVPPVVKPGAPNGQPVLQPVSQPVLPWLLQRPLTSPTSPSQRLLSR